MSAAPSNAGFQLTGGATIDLGMPTLETDAFLRSVGENPDEYYKFDCPMGASRWSTFSCIVNETDFQTLSTTTKPCTITMTDPWGTSVAMTKMYVWDWYYLNPKENMYRVVFADVRALIWQFQTVFLAANWPDPASLSSTPTYIKNTGSGSSTTTAQQLTAIVNAIWYPIKTASSYSSLTLPSSIGSDVAEGINLNNVSAAVALDALLWTYGAVLIFDPTGQNNSGTPTIDLVSNPTSVSALQTWLGQQSQWSNATLPTPPGRTAGLGNISYPVWPQPPWNTVSAPSSGSYQAANGSVVSETGSTGGQISVNGYMPIMGTSFSWNGVAPNNRNLLCTAAQNRQGPLRRNILQGFVAPTSQMLSGAVDRIIWGAIRCNKDYQWSTFLHYQRHQRPYRPDWASLDGIKGASYQNCVSRTDPFGREQIFVNPGNITPVLVKNVSGSDGTQTTQASWTYNVYALSDTGLTTPLNTNGALGVTRPRPNGSMKVPVAGGYGLIFYNNGSIILWDAGEVQNTGNSC